MYRPTMYSKHDESLKKFSINFNSCKDLKHIIIKPNQFESFDNDGEIINLISSQKIGFDWEYRDRYFSNGVFQFDSLGQYERKIKKTSIQLSLQCDSTETSVAFAWHEDWGQEMRTQMHLLTDSTKQKGIVRYTKKYKIIFYKDISDLKKIIDRAFKLNAFNHTSF